MVGSTFDPYLAVGNHSPFERAREDVGVMSAHVSFKQLGTGKAFGYRGDKAHIST